MREEYLTPEEQSGRREAERLDRLTRGQLARDAKEVFGSPAGKRVFWHLLDRCNMFGEVFTGDNNRTNYLLGRRSMGRELLRLREMAGSVQETIEQLEKPRPEA